MWILYAAASAVFAGVTTIFLKKGVHTTNTNAALALRTIVIFVFSIIIVLITGSQNQIYTIKNKTWIFLILSGLSTGAGWYYYYKALQFGNVNKVSPLSKSSLVLTILLSFIFLNEEINSGKLFSIIVITIGTYFIIDYKKSKSENADNNIWLIYAVLSLLFSALTPIFGKIGIDEIESNLGSAIRTFVVVIAAWLILFIKKDYKEFKNVNKSEIKFIILSGITGGSSWLLYYKALQDGVTSAVAAIDKLSLLVAIILSYFIFDEKMNKKTVLGLILILAGTIGLAVK
ncbi:EamA family transporter [Mucispirillum schaedleri]|uniref:EamA family transporter n=1 Tax=Mucispirillum schaedleri TaxID=248039 RepID=UPI001F575F3C|nr:EamA family transporter [Mucispirillum schaedleri]